MEQLGDVVGVVADAEALLDQIADHGPRPHAALITSSQRAAFDDRRQLGALRIAQPRRRARPKPGEQAVDPERLVPLEPAIDRASGHTRLRREVDDSPRFDVPEHGATAPPAIQVAPFLGRLDESPQLLSRRRRPPHRADRLACLRTPHDHVPGDRGTLILRESIVNTKDPELPDPV